MAPTDTLGCESGVLNLEIKRPKVIKINGKKIAVQEKYKTRMSFIDLKAKPCLEKEIITKNDKRKKRVWAIE
jgi:hypothetical protein